MFGILLMVLSFAMIWLAWGFWFALFAFFAKIAITSIFSPTYPYYFNWGAFMSGIGVSVWGVLAVHTKWHEPFYTAAAVIVAVILYVVEMQSDR